MSATPSRPRRRWLRRLVWLGAVAVVLRLLLAAAIPIVAERVVASFGLRCEWEDLDLVLTTGDFRIRGLRVADAETDEDVLFLQRMAIDVDPLGSLSGTPRVRSIDVDGLRLVGGRDGEGRWTFEDYLPEHEPGAPSEPEQAREPAEIPFELPVRVDRIDVRDASIDVFDVRAMQRTRVFATFQARDLGVEDETGTVELRVTSPNLCDSLVAQGSLESTRDTLTLAGSFHCRGFRPDAVREFLEPLGFSPTAEVLDARVVSAEVALRRHDGGVRGTIDVGRCTARADLGAGLELDSLHVEIRRAGLDGVELERVTVAGPRSHATRTEDGALRVLGLEFVGAEPADEEPATPAPPRPGARPAPFGFALDVLEVTGARLALTDELVDPPVTIGFDLESATAGPLALGEEAALRAVGSSPGLLASVTVDGRASVGSDDTRVELTVVGDGLRPEVLASHLERAGFVSTWEEGAFRASLTAALTRSAGGVLASVAVEDVELADAEPIIGLGALRIEDVAMDETWAIVRVGSIALSGAFAGAQRDEQGALRLLGLRTIDTSTPPLERIRRLAAILPPVPDFVIPIHLADTAIEIGDVRFDQGSLAFRDEAVDPVVDIGLEDWGIHVTGLALGGEAGDDPVDALAELWLRAPGILDEGRLDASIRSVPGPLDLTIQANPKLSGVVLDALEAYLRDAGLDPRFEAAELRGALEARLSVVDGRLHAGAELSDVALVDGDVVHLSCARVGAPDVRVSDGELQLGAIEVDSPFVRASRDGAGVLTVAGVRLPGSAAPSSVSTAALTSGSDDEEEDEPPIEESQGRVALESLVVESGELAWRDEAVRPAADLTAGWGLDVRGLAVGRDADWGTYSVGLLVPELVTASVGGRVLLARRTIAGEAEIEATIHSADPVAGYLPPTLRSELDEATVRTSGSASLEVLDEGGWSVRATVGETRFSESATGPTLAGVDGVELVASRIDPASDIFAVDTLAVRGAQLRVRRGDDGAWRALGFAAAPPTDEDAAPPLPELVTPGAGGQAERVWTPTITLAQLELELASLEVDAGLGDGATPLDLSARLTNPEPLVLLDEGAEDLPPIALRVEGAAAPLVGRLDSNLRVSPYAATPHLELDWTASGLRAAGLVDLVPALGESLGGGMVDGEFRGALVVDLEARRKGAYGFDLDAGFGGVVELTGLELRASPGGEVVAGLASLRSEVQRIAPKTGEVHVVGIEISDPTLRARRTTEGIELLGLSLRLPEPAEAGAEAPPTEVAASAPAPAPEPSGGEAVPVVGPEIRVDEVLVHGADVLLRDDSVDPPAVLPIDDAYAELRRFTTLALTESRAIAFSAYLGAGETELGPRKERPDAVPLVREVFGEVAASGSLSLFPAPSGWLKLSVSALELQAFRGLAAAAGIELEDGIADVSARMRLRGERGLYVDSTTVLSRLSVREAEGGPIQSTLGLSVPLDTAIFLLRDTNGELKIPVGFRIGDSGISTAQLAGAAAGAAASVVASAVASSPLRLTGAVTGMFGLGGREPEEPSDEALDVFFPGGDPTLPDEAVATVAPLLERMRANANLVLVLQHELCAADVARAERLANPDERECRDLVERLRQQRRELVRARDEVAADARAYLAVARVDDARTASAQLRAIDAELGATESGLDRIAELLRPGAERKRDKRTRAAALALAEMRLMALRDGLLASLDPEEASLLVDRIELRKPRFEAAEGSAVARVVVTPRKRE